MIAAVGSLLNSVPVELDGPAARDHARREIAKPIYQADAPNPLERLRDWVADRIGSAIDHTASLSPAGIWGWFALLLVVGLAVAAIGFRVGGIRRAAAIDTGTLLDTRLSAAGHRAAAEDHAQAGRWPEAVRERLRAVVRVAEELGVIESRPGRTADEIATDVGSSMPSLAADFAVAARSFDDIWYGGRTGTPEAYATVVRLDERMSRAGRAELVR